MNAPCSFGDAPKLNDAVDRFCGSFKLFATDGTPLRHDQCWMALALKKGEGYNGQEIIIERPDGSRITALAHANPIHDHAGKLLGAVNVLINVGERDQAEQARALLAAVVESSEDAIVSKTLEGRILTWNSGAEQIFGYTAAEAVGSPITLIIPPDRLSEERLILAQIRHGERVAHYETVRMSKSGRRIDISLTISPVKDGTGRIIAPPRLPATYRRESEPIKRFSACRRIWPGKSAILSDCTS